MTSLRLLITFMLLGFGIVTIQALQGGEFPPLPKRFVGLGLVGTVLGVVSLANTTFAAVLGGAVLLGLLFVGTVQTKATPAQSPTGSNAMVTV